MQRAFGWIVLSSLALPVTACSALTEPQELTISAEPIRSPNAPPPAQQAVAERPGGMQMPAAAGGEKKGG